MSAMAEYIERETATEDAMLEAEDAAADQMAGKLKNTGAAGGSEASETTPNATELVNNAAPEAEEALTLAEFKQLLNAFLPSTIGEAKLLINGRLILGVLGYRVSICGDRLTVCLEMEDR